MKVAILLIATNKYKQFSKPLIEQINKYFLPEHEKAIFLFTDGGSDYGENVYQIGIESYGFPEATLLRYYLFSKYSEVLLRYSHVFYLDIDSAIECVVSDEILCDGLTVVYHPGFYSKRDIVGQWGSNGVVKESTAWIEPEKRFGYVAGGFNGGRSKEFVEMANTLSKNIQRDEHNGVMAEYHDESHLNAYLKNIYKGEVLYLTPAYCMVQQPHLQKAWGIDNIEPKIIALEKDHKSIRE